MACSDTDPSRSRTFPATCAVVRCSWFRVASSSTCSTVERGAVTRRPLARSRSCTVKVMPSPDHLFWNESRSGGLGCACRATVRAVTELTDDELAFLQRALDLAREGATEQLAAYVDGGLPVNLTSGAGDSLLILAAYHDHPDTVEALLERGADTARVNDRGQTALAAAAFRRSERSVRALLAAGADPALGPKSALAIATFFELDDMLPLLRSAGTQSPADRS